MFRFTKSFFAVAALHTVMVAAGGHTSAQAAVITLETPSLGVNPHREDWRPAGGFTSGGAFFNNSYSFSEEFGGYWAGFSLSREVDTTTAGFGNQFSAWTGVGFGGSSQYAIGYADGFTVPTITLPAGEVPLSLGITNTTFAALVMRDGDTMFGTEKFGGASGNDPDWFKLVITGLDGASAPTGSVEFYLADYRFANNAQDYIVNSWSTVDLSSLPWSTRFLKFDVASSDVGQFGINTPTYFAADQLTTATPEPGTAALLVLASVGVLGARRRRDHV